MPLSLFAEKPAIDEDNLRVCGFTVLANDDLKLHLSHIKGGQVVISKQKFRHKAAAAAFAAEHPLSLEHLPPGKSPMDSLCVAMLLAMSGACNKKNKFIRDAVLFKFPDTPNPEYRSGVYAWTEGDEDNVTLLWDGHGTECDSLSVDNIKEVFKIEVELPAVYSSLKG